MTTDALMLNPPMMQVVGGPLWSLDENQVLEGEDVFPSAKPEVATALSAEQQQKQQRAEHSKTARRSRPMRKPNSKGMNVKMNPQVRYREIPHLNNMPLEQIHATWLQPDEILETKKAYTEIVRMMMKAREPIEDTDELCTRGLEFRTREGSRRRKKMKRQAIEVVLLEQEIQQEEGISDEQWISEVYREVTSSSSLTALSVGLKDEKYMLELLDPDERAGREGSRENLKSIDIPLPKRRPSYEEMDQDSDDFISLRRE